ncbi:hypothetical protein DV738_g1131, partial [Chaetothyriales sp. CBS 135597]
MAPPRGYQHSMGAPFPSQQSHLQSYGPSQPHGTLPPPQHLGTPSFAGASSGASPFALGGSLNAAFDGGVRDASMLAGHGGQLAFGRRLPVQPQQYDGLQQARDGKDDSRIRNVWKYNLEQEMAALRRLIDEYPYIAMDTEFPGIVARPIGQFTTKADYHYQTLRCNVDLLKMIQLGITLFKADGTLPPPDAGASAKTPYSALTPAPYAWQFNFSFSLETDMYAQESTAMLSKAGIDFDRHAKQGIEPKKFGALLISSGLVLDKSKHWISFHSGYDFAYLIKLMRTNALPDEESEFHGFLDKFFPSLYDIKFMLKHAGGKGSVNNNQQLTAEAGQLLQRIWTKMGLQDIAEELGVSRIGQAHQAGSDALLTGQVFFKMRDKIFNGSIDEARYSGQVWGLNAQMPAIAPSRDTNTPNLNGAVVYNQNGQPSTPQTNTNISMASSSQTPGPQGASHAFAGNITPGGFGAFQYPGAARAS